MDVDEGSLTDWCCLRCTLLNSAGELRCEACGVARGADGSGSEKSESESGGSEDDYDGLEEPEDAAHTVAIHVAKRMWCATPTAPRAGASQRG